MNSIQRKNNFRILRLKSEILSNECKGLRSLIAQLENKKERLKIEEVDAIQQQTMKEMKTLNEQAIVSLTNLFSIVIWLRSKKRFCLS